MKTANTHDALLSDPGALWHYSDVQHLLLATSCDQLHGVVEATIDLHHSHPRTDDFQGIIGQTRIPLVHKPPCCDASDKEGVPVLQRIDPKTFAAPAIHHHCKFARLPSSPLAAGLSATRRGSTIIVLT
mmetsp:Transcript_3812/g.7863  ORF Transcript_3812/g.7863 Transcript_3812/m.7863 type:complete len:129 (+) Transcript_3812:149-535(+)